MFTYIRYVYKNNDFSYSLPTPVENLANSANPVESGLIFEMVKSGPVPGSDQFYSNPVTVRFHREFLIRSHIGTGRVGPLSKTLKCPNYSMPIINYTLLTSKYTENK